MNKVTFQVLNGDRRGMTLIELLVVLVIISILASVAFRAIDITRERANYDKTMKAMERLSQSIAGNPTLVAEGRRTDFGFVGDVGRLPGSLDELRTNTQNDSVWNGPYVRLPFEGDSSSYRTDAWGRDFQYLPEQAAITSLGNGKSPITYRIIEDTAFLFRNRISGTITDNDGNVPGAAAPSIRVRLWLPDLQTGQMMPWDTFPEADGHYVFDESHFRVPVGTHEIMVVRNSGVAESLTKWVTVMPRVGAVADFRFPSSMVGELRLSGPVTADPFGGPVAASVAFNVVNVGGDSLHPVNVDTVAFYRSDSTVFCSGLRLYRREKWHAGARAGNGDAMGFDVSPESVLAYSTMQVNLDSFMSGASGGGDTLMDMHGKTLRLRFSDGSVVSVPIP